MGRCVYHIKQWTFQDWSQNIKEPTFEGRLKQARNGQRSLCEESRPSGNPVRPLPSMFPEAEIAITHSSRGLQDISLLYLPYLGETRFRFWGLEDYREIYFLLKWTLIRKSSSLHRNQL